MKFSCETEYDQKTMTAMAKALRKTLRKKRSRRSHILGWMVVALALLLSCWSADKGFAVTLEMRTIITFAMITVLIVVLLWEDRINGYIARKRLLAGTEKSNIVFEENEFVCSTDVGTSTFNYDKIKMVAEDKEHFVFVYSSSHAQIYDKRKIRGGTLQEFRDFIEQVTGKHIVKV